MKLKYLFVGVVYILGLVYLTLPSPIYPGTNPSGTFG